MKMSHRVSILSVLLLLITWIPCTAFAQSIERAIGVEQARSRTSTGGQRWALIVGINEYTNVPTLRFARADAEALYKVLVEQCGFPKDNVVLMTDARQVRLDDPTRYPTRGNLRARIDTISQIAEKNDLLLVSFSGHGLNIDGRGYLVPVDGTSKDLGSLLPLSWVKETLESCPAKQRLLILDACHSGARAGGSAESPAQALLSPLTGAAFATIASCDSRQLSHEDPATNHGVFTHAIIDGLTGNADKQAEGNRDSTITANELFAYASLKVKQWSLRKGKEQTPVLRGEFKDRIELARIASADSSPAVDVPPSLGPQVPRPGEIRSNSVGIKLVYIGPGEFLMGSSLSAMELASKFGGKAEYYKDAYPQHRVQITKGFWMSQTEVTQAQYKSIMNSQPWSGQTFVKDSSNNAASYVSWDDAVEFCRKLSQQDGRKYRLPTEAEWEYACRAGTQTVYSFGNNESSLGDYGWYRGNAYEMNRKYAHPVAQKKPNAFGLYDMHGNVWEWCSDWYDEDYYSQRTSVDPQGSSTGKYRVLRGGSWLRGPVLCRSADRDRITPDYRDHGDGGFRIIVLDF